MDESSRTPRRRRVIMGEGSVVSARSAINPGAVIGRGCIVNTGATVDHDGVLAEAVHACAGAHLAGHVHVGARTGIGIGDMESGLTVMSVPARAKQGQA